MQQDKDTDEVMNEHEVEKEELIKDVAVWEGSSNDGEDDVYIEESRQQIQLRARCRMKEEELLEFADENKDQVGSASEEESSD